MINFVLILAASSCPAPKIINNTSTEIDKKVLNRATYVCKTRYSGCLKTLIKTKEKAYRAICKRNEPNE